MQSLELDTFIEGGMLEKFAILFRSIHSDQGIILVNHLYRYENPKETIQSIFNELNLTRNSQLPKARPNLRTNKISYRDLLNPNQKNQTGNTFA